MRRKAKPRKKTAPLSLDVEIMDRLRRHVGRLMADGEPRSVANMSAITECALDEYLSRHETAQEGDAKRVKQKRNTVPRRVTKPSRRLPHGLRTPPKEFRIPILLALTRKGNVARASEVLSDILDQMKDRLHEVDFQLVSKDSIERWKNTASWARYYLAQEGLLSKDTPKGIWEITEAGQDYLAKAQSMDKDSIKLDKENDFSMGTLEDSNARSVKGTSADIQEETELDPEDLMNNYLRSSSGPEPE